MLFKIKLKKKMSADENLDSAMDFPKFLKPWPVKARNKRIPISQLPPLPPLPVHDSPAFTSSSDEIAEPADSGSLKRKLEGTDQNEHGKFQKTDSRLDSPRIWDTEGSLYDVEIRETEINVSNLDETLSLSVETISMEGSSTITTTTTDDQAADIRNQVASSVSENGALATPKNPKIYACSMCNKTFSSHLALGGHKSSHNKFRIVISNAIDDRRKKQSVSNTCDQPQTDKAEEIEASPESVLGNGKTHKCKICFKIFSSGQALGGHQRRHWTGNMPVEKTQSSVPRILDFDLNDLPKEDDEDPSSKC